MSYSVRCPGCHAVQDVAQLTQQPDGKLRCNACRASKGILAWTHETHGGANPVPNALPRDTFLLFGEKTKERVGPGVLRGYMEEQSEMRPGADARPGGGNYTGLSATATTKRASIYILKDDVLLQGRYYPPPPAGGIASGLCMLLLNGSGASIGKYLQAVIDKYQSMGAAVLAMDYRGIGQSTGRGTAHGLYMDAEAMLRYLVAPVSRNGEGWDPGNVVVHGFSIGSAPATELAKNHCRTSPVRIGGVVLHCPIASFGSTAEFKLRDESWVARKIAGKVSSWGVGFNNDKKLLHIDLPVHIVYAKGDTFVDPGDARRLKRVQRAGNTTIQAYTPGDHADVANIFNNALNTTNHDAVAPTTGTLDAFLTNLPRN